MCASVCVSMSMCVYMCVSVSMRVCVYLCVYVCECVYVYVSMFVLVSACLHTWVCLGGCSPALFSWLGGLPEPFHQVSTYL